MKTLRKLAALLLAAALALTNLPATFAVEEEPQAETTMQKVSARLSERKEDNVLEGAMPCRGNAHMLVIDMTLAGQENEISTEEVRNILFGEHYSFDFEKRDENVTDYFQSISYGKLNVTGDVVSYTCEKKPEMSDLPAVLDEVLEGRDLSRYDMNNDGYFDGISFLYPDNCHFGNATGFVTSWDYEFSGYKSKELMVIPSHYGKNTPGTFEHETVHLMGLPDIYAGVSLNPNGTYSDSMMGGGLQGFYKDQRYQSSDIPGIMKFLFGWIDDITEVYETEIKKTYTLPSYSVNSSAMIIYPNGDINSKFVFFVENFTPERNNLGVIKDSYVRKTGGLRIWKVYMYTDDNGNIIGNDTAKGCGTSPYSYLECVNNGEKFLLLPGMELSDYSTPSNVYHDKFYDEGGNRYPENELDSNVDIRNLSQTENGAVFDVSICDHIETSFEGREATCTESGYDEGKLCTVCGSVTRYINYVPAFGHTEIIEAAYDATCTEDGSTERRYCSVCGEVTKEGEVLPALGHNWTDWRYYILPGCEYGGEEERHCSRGCGAGETRPGEPLGHIWGEWEIFNKPTCTSGGNEIRYCEKTREHWETRDLEPLGHTAGEPVKENEVEATCEKEGFYDNVLYCTVCEKEISRETIVVPALGHDFGEWYETKAPTPAENGEERRDCNNCDHYETRETEKLDVPFGDVNGDGKINVIDANIIRRYAARLAELDANQLLAADVDGNGNVNVIDANIIRRYASKIIDKFPAEG